jgi:ABC-2 type transport system permease protein
MRPVFASELLKIRSLLSNWILLGLSLLIGPVLAGLITTFADDVDNSVALAGATLASPLMASFAALTGASEYRHNTLRQTFTSVPRRTRVLVAKAVIALGAVGAVLLASVVTSWALASAIAAGTQTDGLLSTDNFASELGSTLGWALGYSVVAFCLGVLFKTPVFAIVAIIVYPLVIDPILAAISTVPEWWPVTGLILFFGGDDGVRWFQGPLIATVLVVLAVVAATQVFLRRDA